jgi:CheY-like chemotaxis protein
MSIQSHLEEILKAAMRSAGLTRQLLAFARQQPVTPRVVDLNKTVKGMMEMLQRLIGEDISLSLFSGKELWPVRMDPSQIDQTMANLCVNARDAIEDIGRITIETANACLDERYCSDHPGFVPGEYVVITVSDDGCGMEKEMMAKIFDPFFTTKRVGEGTGLGLSTVYGIVKQNNGFINVYSEPGLGTRFALYFPRCEGATVKSEKKVEQVSDDSGRETILLVEDEPAILKMVGMLLRRQGYKVLSADSPGKGIRLTLEYNGKIHMLLTDVVMPEMNGRDLSQHLLSIFPDLNVLFMSGYTANAIAKHGILAADVNYIQKPFSPKNLTAKVREILDSGLETRSPAVKRQSA